MGFSSKKPYQKKGLSVGEFFRSSTRFLKESTVGPESVFEKPYRDSEYGDMHQSPNLPAIVPPIGGTGGLECLFSETQCAIDAECFAGPDVRITGGPKEAQAGYLDPEVLAGGLVKVEKDDRWLKLVLDNTVVENIIRVVFVDGWGDEHTQEIHAVCTTRPTFYDEFTGANGDPPNVAWWTTYLWGSMNTLEIQNNRLQIDPFLNGYAEWISDVAGDFEIVVDWIENADIGANTGSFYLEARIDANNSMGILYNPQEVGGVGNPPFWGSERVISGVNDTVLVEEDVTVGAWRKFKLRRVGTEWSSYLYTSGGAFTAMHDLEAVGDGDVTILRIGASGQATDVSFDNFSITLL